MNLRQTANTPQNEAAQFIGKEYDTYVNSLHKFN